MDWFLILLAVTTAVRGFGAGIIYDVALVSLPVRYRIGAIPYANFARANFTEGVKTYLPVSILGALLTVAVAICVFIRGDSAIVIWSVAISLVATIIAFIGTSQALPPMLSLRQAPDDNALLSKILNRFAQWHAFSAIWQLVAFIALIIALATAGR